MMEFHELKTNYYQARKYVFNHFLPLAWLNEAVIFSLAPPVT
jgi:hypothetical protein